MSVDAERCEDDEGFNYNHQVLQTMKQHRMLSDEEEEEELRSYLRLTQRCQYC